MEVQLSAEYHWLNSDANFPTTVGTSSHYGKELDLVAGYNYDKNWSGKLEYFSFKEDAVYISSSSTLRKPDSDKFMATLMYTF